MITGGDSGIGRAIAVLYAREGEDVAIAYLPQEQSDARAANDLSARPVLIIGPRAALDSARDPIGCFRMVRHTLDKG